MSKQDEQEGECQMENWKLGVGPAHNFEIMANRTGWTNVDFSRLAADEVLNRKVLAVLRDQAEITVPSHLIDLDAAPFVPNGWSVHDEDQIESRAKGTMIWDTSKLRLHLDKGQTGSKVIEGNKLRKALKGQPVMNANVLDYLLAHPELIPEEWKAKAVFFWGTIYRNSDGKLYVRCLDWDGGRWCWRYNWLGHVWGSDSPAAVLAS